MTDYLEVALFFFKKRYLNKILCALIGCWMSSASRYMLFFFKFHVKNKKLAVVRHLIGSLCSQASRNCYFEGVGTAGCFFKVFGYLLGVLIHY